MWVKEDNRNIVIGEISAYEWDVKSEYYFSVTFKSASIVGTIPR